MKSILSSLVVSLGLSIALLIYAINHFRADWAYSEIGHGYLAIGLIIISVLVFISLRLSKIVPTILLLLIFTATITYSSQKFEWRKDYIQSAERGNFFALEPYIEKYPTFEDQLFASFTNKPQWVKFSQDCYEPMLRRNFQKSELKNSCRNSASIQDNYNVDVSDIINAYYRRMTNTAKQIEKQRFKTKAQFETCIQSKKCAMIPLLPEGADVDARTNNYIDIRNQFWSLINDKQISSQNCDFFDFCRVMRQNDIYVLPKARS